MGNKKLADPKKHPEVLHNLLDELRPIDTREFLKLPEDLQIRQKYITVAVVKNLLEVAAERKWNMAKVYDYLYIYNGCYWEQLDKEQVKSFLGKAAIRMGSPEYDARYYEFKESLYKQFQSDAFLPAPKRNEDKVSINLLNGTMEFSKSGCHIREFNPEDFITYQLPFPYDQNATSPLFEKYLNEVLPDENSQMILQEFSGYIFTDLNLEKMLMLTGSGANGKSVFFNILRSLVGKQNILTYSMGMFDHEYNRAKLTNVLVNYSSEKGTELNPDIFKALVSGEPIQAREPYGKPFTLENRVRFIVNVNELPRETEQTEAYFRRYLIVPFDVTIPEEKRDIDLAKKIIASELSGVFNWLLIGLERILTQRQFTVSAKAKTALEDFKKQSDSVALFIEEFGFHPSATIKSPVSELYMRYKNFCNDDGYMPVGKKKFSTRLENKGFERCRLSNGGAAFHIASHRVSALNVT